MPRAPKHSKPFSSGGYKNKAKCFSAYAADDFFASKSKAKVRDPSRPQSSRPRSRRPAKKTPNCDKNGCPVGTHTGKTSLRHKSINGTWVGGGVPHGAAKMDYTKEYEWMAGAPLGKHADTHNYRDNTPEHNSKSVTKNGAFRHGAIGDGGLFDKTVRVQASDGTFAPDLQLMQWVSGNRVDHPRPFARSSYPQEDGADRGFVGHHKHFKTGFNPYKDYEGTKNKTKGHFHHGHRPANRTSSQGTPWRVPSEHNPLQGTDRNSRLYAVRSRDQMDHHDGAGGRSSQWVSHRSADY